MLAGSPHAPGFQKTLNPDSTSMTDFDYAPCQRNVALPFLRLRAPDIGDAACRRQASMANSEELRSLVQLLSGSGRDSSVQWQANYGREAISVNSRLDFENYRSTTCALPGRGAEALTSVGIVDFVAGPAVHAPHVTSALRASDLTTAPLPKKLGQAQRSVDPSFMPFHRHCANRGRLAFTLEDARLVRSTHRHNFVTECF